ncbi:MAG: hypothetical protein M1475_04335 [Actinobacteria bacterium]|nr:hypothetical protein [Actinomycetota bacterium]
MTKAALVLVGVAVIIMGFISIVPQIAFAKMPLWYGLLVIAIGLISAIVGLMAKKPGK